MKKVKKAILIIVICFGIFALGLAAFALSHYLKIKKDLDRLQTEEYDSIFLSMYSIQEYEEEDWMHFWARDIVKTDYVIPNNKVLQKYMETAKASQKMLNRVYLGIEPKEIAKEEVVLMIQQNPSIYFEVVLAYPQIEYWLDMEQEECEALIQHYQTFAEWVVLLENADVYFLGSEEWLLCNPKNYVDTFTTNAAVSRFLMCNFDKQHEYVLSTKNIQERFDLMRSVVAEYRENDERYPEIPDMDIVFLGDSIIGNYTDTLSVPEVVSGLSKAQVFNLGYGGKGAAKNEQTPISFPEIADALIKGDVKGLPEEEQVTIGMKNFLEREKQGKQLMFVINFGLNDYFNGVKIAGEEPLDITTYQGALRAGIKKLQEAYPETQILLMTPNFTTYSECGKVQKSEVGGVLEEYVEAVLSLAEECEVNVLDNYHELPITLENWKKYLADGCHLNERGRFLVGKRIAQKLKTE